MGRKLHCRVPEYRKLIGWRLHYEVLRSRERKIGSKQDGSCARRAGCYSLCLSCGRVSVAVLNLVLSLSCCVKIASCKYLFDDFCFYHHYLSIFTYLLICLFVLSYLFVYFYLFSYSAIFFLSILFLSSLYIHFYLFTNLFFVLTYLIVYFYLFSYLSIFTNFHISLFLLISFFYILVQSSKFSLFVRFNYIKI